MSYYYEQMDEAGVLEDLDEPVWMNLAGEIVNSEAEAFGEQVSKTLKHNSKKYKTKTRTNQSTVGMLHNRYINLIK